MGKAPKKILLANQWWHSELIGSVVRQAAQRGWHVDLQVCLGSRIPETWTGDGIVTFLGGNRRELKRLLQRTGVPAVSLNLNYPEMQLPTVTQDDVLAGQMAARHFIDRGFRLYSFYSHFSFLYSVSLRCKAYEEAVAHAGHSVKRIVWERHSAARTDWDERQEWLRKQLHDLEKPLAVFCANDEGAVDVLEACVADGFGVPDEVAVLGHLDMPLFRESTTISLSSVQVDVERIAFEGCELLARMMDGEPPPSEPILVPPTGVAARRSTETIAAPNPAVAKVIRYMFEHYSEPVDVDDLARVSGECKTLLYDAFRQDLGTPPMRLLARIRIRKARELLASTKMPVEDIAMACGFGDRINLYRSFRRQLGCSPGTYRKEQLAAKY